MLREILAAIVGRRGLGAVALGTGAQAAPPGAAAVGLHTLQLECQLRRQCDLHAPLPGGQHRR